MDYSKVDNMDRNTYLSILKRLGINENDDISTLQNETLLKLEKEFEDEKTENK